jgi:hypothetical protein
MSELGKWESESKRNRFIEQPFLADRERIERMGQVEY